MTPIPRWSASMSTKDPLLDAQHIELLEMCRSIQSDLEQKGSQSWAFLQRLNEFAFLLREHDDAETRVLHQGGQDMSQDLRTQRALALRDIEELVSSFQLNKFDPVLTQRKVCHWIQYHL